MIPQQMLRQILIRRKWLDTTFCDWVPTEVDWQTILDKDKEAAYITDAAGCVAGEVLVESDVQDQLYLQDDDDVQQDEQPEVGEENG